VRDEVWLFSYGTLRQAEVQRALFGRELRSEGDRLMGFALGTVTIRDPEVVRLSGSDRHPILRRAAADCMVEGTALALTQGEIEAADRYEVADYVRIPVTLASGREAFVYVHRDEAGGR
jgi:hypothetical protein